MENQELTQIWNSAVSKVGGHRNTDANFVRIGQEFLNQCKASGRTERESRAFLQDHYESVAAFFVRC